MLHPDKTHRSELPWPVRDIFEGPSEPCTEESCLDDETLAAWLDETLDEGEQVAVLKHLTRCRSCQARLVELHRDIAYCWDSDTPLPVVEQRLQGLVFKWMGHASNGNGTQHGDHHLVEVAEREKSKDRNDSDDEERKRRFVSGQS